MHRPTSFTPDAGKWTVTFELEDHSWTSNVIGWAIMTNPHNPNDTQIEPVTIDDDHGHPVTISELLRDLDPHLKWVVKPQTN